MAGEGARQVLSNYLSLVEVGTGFGVSLHGELLKTPAGQVVESRDVDFLRHMIAELEEHPVLTVCDGVIEEPRQLCAYLIYSTQKDFTEAGRGMDASEIPALLEADPVMHPSAGPEWTDQLRAWEPLSRFLSAFGQELHPRAAYRNFPEQVGSWEGFCTAMTQVWKDLSAPQKAAVAHLRDLTYGHVIASMALARGEISDIEFSNAVVAGSPSHYVFAFYPDEEGTPEQRHAQATKEMREIARICQNYLRLANPIEQLVASGESAKLEFKSTLRWDIREDKENPGLQKAVLKTIAAFLNTEGGTLLIGVGDDGTPVGIEKDRFPNDDKFQLHLMNLVKASMGDTAATLVDVAIVPYRSAKVARVHCERSRRPVYLQNDADSFFVRTGPGSRQLSTREAVTYIQDHFPPDRRPSARIDATNDVRVADAPDGLRDDDRAVEAEG